MFWTETEVECLKKSYPYESDRDLARQINKSATAVRIKASREGIRKNSLIYRENLRLNKNEEQVIIGGLLGDLHCRKTKTSKNARVEGGHCIKQAGYLYYKIRILRRLKCFVRPSKQDALFFQSKSFPCLNEYHDSFYSGNKKGVNRSILNKLDTFGLMIWYMDDGCLSRDGSCNLHTNNFSFDEQLIIIDYFEGKWDIHPRIYRNKDNKKYEGKVWYYIYFPKKETIKLHDLFKDFEIPTCMKYKFLFTRDDAFTKNPTPGALVAHN